MRSEHLGVAARCFSRIPFRNGNRYFGERLVQRILLLYVSYFGIKYKQVVILAY